MNNAKQPIRLSDKIGHINCDPEALKDPEFVSAINNMVERAYHFSKKHSPKGINKSN